MGTCASVRVKLIIDGDDGVRWQWHKMYATQWMTRKKHIVREA